MFFRVVENSVLTFLCFFVQKGEGRGATFGMILPCPDDAVPVVAPDSAVLVGSLPSTAATKSPRRLDVTSASSAGGKGGVRVLIVEDSVVLASILKRQLSKLGYEVSVAGGKNTVPGLISFSG